MDITNQKRASVLVQALPYIKKYVGKIVVVKYGGNAMIDENLKSKVMKDIVLLSLIGVRVVLVHGGGPEISSTLTQLGKKTEFKNGLRVTDKETVDVVQMVLAGKVNKSLVNLLGVKGGNAIGLSGLDGKMLIAETKNPELGYVGEIKKVNVEPILDLLEKGYIPVISTVAGDEEGNVYNVNADTAAAKIAGELHAEGLISMTDIAGILRNQDDPNSLIKKLSIEDADKLIEEGVIGGGMIPKVECCVNALKWGVKKVFIIDGRIPHSIIVEMLTDEGIGTMFEGEVNE